MLRKEAQVRDLQQRLENGEGSKYLINYLISECKLECEIKRHCCLSSLCHGSLFINSHNFPISLFIFCFFALRQLFVYSSQLFVYFFVWHVHFRSGSSNIRASQLFNARGKKLGSPLASTASTASKATQTSIGSSTSTSMASVKRVQDSPNPVLAPSSNNVVNNEKVKDRTLFQRLFQR